MSTNLFETWFASEMVKYRDDDDMIRALLRAKEDMRTGFSAGLQNEEVLTVGLRDQIAIAYMQSCVAGNAYFETFEGVSEEAYKMADAMLKERAK